MKFGLALGGGGARGSAHLGVLMELRDVGLWPPDIVTGTSIGGIIGGLLGCGLSLEDIAEFSRQLKIDNFFSLPNSQPSLLGNKKIEAMLEDIIGRPTFADLQFPLSVAAVDLISRREVMLSEGDLIIALMATSALPVIAPPIKYKDMVLVDGGLLNNVPFDVTRALGATHVVAVDLTRSAPYGELNETPPTASLWSKALSATQRRPLWQVVSTVADIISSNGVRARLAISPPDIMIQPDIDTIGLFDFHRIHEGVIAGKQAAQTVMPKLLELKAKKEKFENK